MSLDFVIGFFAGIACVFGWKMGPWFEERGRQHYRKLRGIF